MFLQKSDINTRLVIASSIYPVYLDLQIAKLEGMFLTLYTLKPPFLHFPLDS